MSIRTGFSTPKITLPQTNTPVVGVDTEKQS